jgi:hypothetical protein
MERENVTTADLAGAESTDDVKETGPSTIEPVPMGSMIEPAAEAPRDHDAAARPLEQSPSAATSPPDPPALSRAESAESEDRAAGTDPALLPDDQAASFRTRWDPIQAAFVDEPSSAVQDADGLVAEVMQAVAQSFADERARLEAHWKQGEDVSTEDLRRTLQRYRSFFQRLLSA